METTHDKQLNQLVGKSIRLASLDSPSDSFEKILMQKIQTIKMKRSYKPLISKFTWSLLGLLFLSLMTYLMLTSDAQQTIWFKNMYCGTTSTSRFFNAFDGLKFDSTIFYSVTCFFIALAIQLPILKQHFDKQLSSNEDKRVLLK